MSTLSATISQLLQTEGGEQRILDLFAERLESAKTSPEQFRATIQELRDLQGVVKWPPELEAKLENLVLERWKKRVLAGYKVKLSYAEVKAKSVAALEPACLDLAPAENKEKKQELEQVKAAKQELITLSNADFKTRLAGVKQEIKSIETGSADKVRLEIQLRVMQIEHQLEVSNLLWAQLEDCEETLGLREPSTEVSRTEVTTVERLAALPESGTRRLYVAVAEELDARLKRDSVYATQKLQTAIGLATGAIATLIPDKKEAKAVLDRFVSMVAKEQKDWASREQVWLQKQQQSPTVSGAYELRHAFVEHTLLLADKVWTFIRSIEDSQLKPASIPSVTEQGGTTSYVLFF